MSHRHRLPRRISRRNGALAVLVVSALIALGFSPLAFGGPIGYVQPTFGAPGAAAPGQTVTLTPNGPCRAGHGGYGSAYLFEPLDASYTSRPAVTVPIRVSTRTNLWDPVRITVPANARAATYILGVSCGGYPGQGVDTSYRGVNLKVTGTCGKPFFVGLRGSGEDASAGTNGMGTLINYVYRQTSSRAGVAMDVIPRSEQANRYDAVKVGDYRYLASVDSGKNLVLDQVRARIRACGDQTRIVMAGYSQGAHAIHDALDRMSASERAKVVGVTMFGNPVHTPFVNGDAGPSRGVGLFGPRAALGNGLPSRMQDYCNIADPVCEGLGAVSLTLLAFRDCDRSGAACVHTHYIATHGDRASEYLAGRLR